MSLRPLAAGLLALAVATVGGCSSTPSSSTGGAPAPAPAAAGTTPAAASTPAVASTPAAAPNPAPAPAVKRYGVSSKECAAASAILMGATKIGGLANQGKVTQADFEAAYTGAKANDLPVDALPVFADLKTVSLKVVGLDATAATAHLGEFGSALGAFTSAAGTICS